MNCNKCGRKMVHPDDYGDYDDACEWACNCEKIYVEKRSKFLFVVENTCGDLIASFKDYGTALHCAESMADKYNWVVVNMVGDEE